MMRAPKKLKPRLLFILYALLLVLAFQGCASGPKPELSPAVKSKTASTKSVTDSKQSEKLYTESQPVLPEVGTRVNIPVLKQPEITLGLEVGSDTHKITNIGG